MSGLTVGFWDGVLAKASLHVQIMIGIRFIVTDPSLEKKLFWERKLNENTTIAIILNEYSNLIQRVTPEN